MRELLSLVVIIIISMNICHYLFSSSTSMIEEADVTVTIIIIQYFFGRIKYGRSSILFYYYSYTIFDAR